MKKLKIKIPSGANEIIHTLQDKGYEAFLCGGAMIFTVTECMSWKKPTEEQIKNLHDTLCIDVEILEDGE